MTVSDPRIAYVEETFGFMFDGGFAPRFASLGSPPNDLTFWYRNAQVYRSLTAARPVHEGQRSRLLTLIEALRMQSMCGTIPGEDPSFDVSSYEFSEDILAYKSDALELVLQQEREFPSSIDPIDPAEPVGDSLH